VAGSVHSWFRDPANAALLERLKNHGVRTEDEATVTLPSVFAGMQFVLTGGLTSMTRDEAEAAIEARGGRVTSSVSKKTSVVVVGADAGSKLEKATALGLRCVDETAFVALLGEPPA